MEHLKIPPSPYKHTDGSTWPRHRAKARSKTMNRRRVLADLTRENDRGISYSQ
jgi:hypothetical protein